MSAGQTPSASGSAEPAGAGRGGFAQIDTWVFDLDNTLYPQTADLWPKIDARITLFMMRLFGLDALSLRALQKHYYHRYGTTLRGLMLEHQIDAEAFLSFVHDRFACYSYAGSIITVDGYAMICIK